MFKRSLIGVAQPWFGNRLIASADGGGDGGGGGGGEGKVTFTPEQQAKVDAIVADTKRTFTEKLKDYDELKSKAGKVDEMQAQLDELDNKIKMAGKSAEEKAKLEAEARIQTLEREKAALEEKLGEANGNAEKATKSLEDYKLGAKLGEALRAADVFDKSFSDALHFFQTETTDVAYGERGEITALTLGGKRYVDAKEAAAAFLEGRPHYANNGVSGSGTTGNGDGGGGGAKKLDDMSKDELWAAAHSEG